METLKLLKRQYYDWRVWDHLYRNMNKEAKRVYEARPALTTIPYVNKPGVAFSLDDSFRVQDWYEYGKDMFGYYDVRVTFNVNAHHHYEGQRKHTQEEIDMLLELQANGHEIAHHGFKHMDARTYTNKYGVKKWINDEIQPLFEWLEEQSHSITGEKFKRPTTFAFPYFNCDDSTLKEIVPKYFKVARGYKRGTNLISFGHSGFVPSICIDSIYLTNPSNVTRLLKVAKKSGLNLIFTLHSILPENHEWKEFNWQMTDHEKKWRTSPKVIQAIINAAKENDMEFYTTAELAGIATFIDRNFERHIRKILSKKQDDWILISELIYIKQLDISHEKVSNLDGIQYFRGLEKLSINNREVANLRLLRKLPKLSEVKRVETAIQKSQ